MRNEIEEMVEEIMTEWIEFKIGKDETLRCDSCFKYLHDQQVHFYLNDDGATATEVICDACWKEDQKEGIDGIQYELMNKEEER